MNQGTAIASAHQDGNKRKKPVPRPKLREEVRSVIEQPSEGATVALEGSRGKRKATIDFDNDQYALRSQILINTSIDNYNQG